MSRNPLCALLMAGGALCPGWTMDSDADMAGRDCPPYAVPEVLCDGGGGRIADARAWRRHRQRLLDGFARQVYGLVPSPPVPVRTEMLEVDAPALAGTALRTQVRLLVGGTVPVDVLVYRPATAPRPVPAILGLNFHGNQGVHADPGIRLCSAWQEDHPGIVGHRATAAARGAQAAAIRVETILARGFAFITACYADWTPDHPAHQDLGIIPLHYPQGVPADGMRAIGAWAWGLSRMLDLAEQLPALDRRRIAVFGHSRLGKAAIWAAAQDERFALVISNNSGCLGAALTRRVSGEQLHHITAAFPHWFVPGVAAYAGRDREFPLEQHQLLACIAPRPLYVGSAAEDAWADPRGEFLATSLASAVWELLGSPGLGTTVMPAPDRPVHGGLAYHLRSGGHALTAWDWERYLDYAARMLPAPR